MARILAAKPDELKIVKRIIQKYNGFLTTESNGGFFAIKAVFPVQ